MQVAVLEVLVPLLVDVAKPPGAAPVTPVLRSMACKLVSAMPTSAAAGAFRAAVAALPAASKERLQAALREQAAADQAAAAGGSTVQGAGVQQRPEATQGRKPAIQLTMNFQLPKANR